MKKIKALLLAGVMTLSVAMAAMADEPTATQPAAIESIKLSKIYNIVNTGSVSPAETFKFTITPGTVTDAGVDENGEAVKTVPQLLYKASENTEPETADNMTIEYCASNDENFEKEIEKNLILPKYTAVGTYTYTIKETAGTTAGVTYDDKEILVTITVINGENGVYPAAVTMKSVGGTKMSDEDGFVNTYEAAKELTVTKEVKGNMGDKNKDFAVTVSFKVPEGKTLSSINYTKGTDDKEHSVSESEGYKATFTLKHGETATFKNIPYGVTYSVEEKDYTGEGYAAAMYALNDGKAGTTAISDEEIDSASEKVVITNSKGTDISTGISLDNIPYIILLAVVVLGGVGIVMRKRNTTDRD